MANLKMMVVHGRKLRWPSALLFRGMALLAIWLVSLPILLAGENSDQTDNDQTKPPIEAFDQAYQAYRQYRLDLLPRLRDAMTLPPHERGELLREASIQSDVLLTATIDAAEQALRADPKNQKVRRFLLLITQRAFAADRFELAGRLAKLLLDHGSGNTGLYRVAGHSFLEMGDIDQAEKYLRAAEKANDLDVYGRAYLKKIDSFRQLIEGAKQFERQDATKGDLPRVLLKTTRGNVLVELFEDHAPNAVAAFVYLVDQGFYDGLPFYRVMRGFGAVTGSPNGDGTGGPDFRILNNASRSRPHLRGTLSMVPDSENHLGSIFLISFRMTSNTKLNGKYMVFGRVIEGMDVVMRFNDTNPDLVEEVGVEPDRILQAEVVRRRNHVYRPTTIKMLVQQIVQECRDLLAKNKIDEAIQKLHAAAQLDTSNVDVCFTLGMLYARKKGKENSDRALYFLNKAAALDPDNLENRFYLGTVLMRRSKAADAVEQFETVLAKKPDHFQAWHNLGVARAQQGRLRDAAECFEKALALKPGYKSARDNLARVQAQLRRNGS